MGPYNSQPRSKKHYFRQNLTIFGHFWAKADFCFVLAALRPSIGCSNTTPNTFPSVCPRPRQSTISLQNVGAFQSKEPPIVMKTMDNRNKPHQSEHLSIWFFQSVQHCTKCITNTKKKSIFGKKLAIHGHFWAETDFSFCAGGPATPDRLLQYNSKHVSVGPSPTPAVVNHPTKRSCIRNQGTTNGNENKGRSQQAPPL